MSPDDILPYLGTVIAHINADVTLPGSTLLLAGDGTGQVRPLVGVFLDQPELSRTKMDGAGNVYNLPFQVSLIVLPEPSETKDAALITALKTARLLVRSLRSAHTFDELVLSADEPISFIHLDASSTIIAVNYELNVVI